MDIVSILSGGVTGIVGSAVSAWINHKQRGQQNDHDLRMREFDLKELELEASSAEKVGALQLEGQEIEASAAVQRASYREAAARFTAGLELTGGQAWLLVIVDTIRGLMRPVLTVYFTAMLGVAWAAFDDRPDLREKAASAIVYLAIMTVSWWFGARFTEKMMAGKLAPAK